MDVAIHSPVTGDGHNPRNHHTHLLFTTREVANDGLGAKTRILDDKTTGPQEIKIIREVWETLAKVDYPALDREQTRSTFNAEIKALNEKRAAFGDKPLIEKIAQLDRLMERLDKRVEKLQALETKTTLKAAIRQSIAKVVKLAADLLINRKAASAALKLTAEEKQARKERQIIHYGRSYREGLRYQIKEIKQNMAIVEAKKEDFRHYKSFVDKIDRDLKNTTPQSLPVLF